MLKKSTYFKVNGIALYDPSSCSVEVMPIHDEDSGVDANENMHLTVKGFRRKVTINYQYMNGDELKYIYNLLIKKTNYYLLQYVDALLGITTMECYIPQYNSELFNLAIQKSSGGLYSNITLEFIGSRMTYY
ncbi:MAG: hypothetical protein RR623_03970 [Bacilli bacterium]